MTPAVHVRSLSESDAPAWTEMRCALWPDGDHASHGAEVARYLRGELRMPLEVLIAFDDANAAIGFAELSIRAYAEECVTDRVAYLEGWYVVPAWRRRGVGKALVDAAEAWARAQRCTEFGSDAVIDNDVSAAAHVALGFEETVRLRCFRKTLRPDAAPDDA